MRTSGCNFGRSSFQTHIISSLVSFFILFDHFLTLYSFLGAATKGWKESIGGPESELHAESFQKKKINNKIKYCRGSPDPNFIGATISSHIISFRLLPISGHLQKSEKNKTGRFEAEN